MKTLTKAVGSSMDGFLVQHSGATKVTERPETTTRNQGNAATGTIGSFLRVTCNECLHAEILWTLKVVQSHYSFHSCSDVQQLFAQMIPDSEITKQFSCGEKSVHIFATLALHHTSNSYWKMQLLISMAMFSYLTRVLIRRHTTSKWIFIVGSGEMMDRYR